MREGKLTASALGETLPVSDRSGDAELTQSGVIVGSPLYRLRREGRAEAVASAWGLLA